MGHLPHHESYCIVVWSRGCKVAVGWWRGCNCPCPSSGWVLWAPCSLQKIYGRLLWYVTDREILRGDLLCLNLEGNGISMIDLTVLSPTMTHLHLENNHLRNLTHAFEFKLQECHAPVMMYDCSRGMCSDIMNGHPWTTYCITFLQYLFMRYVDNSLIDIAYVY